MQSYGVNQLSFFYLSVAVDITGQERYGKCSLFSEEQVDETLLCSKLYLVSGSPDMENKAINANGTTLLREHGN